jgi:hypothetical protein
MARKSAFHIPVLFLLACATGDTDPEQVAIRMDGESVTLGQLQADLNRRGPGEFDGDDSDSAAVAFAGSVLDKMLLSREAFAHPRGDTTGIARRLEQTRLQEVVSVLREEVGADLTPEQLETMFAWTGQEVRVRHIQVGSYAEALDVKAAIDAGTSFESLVDERSMDAFSKPKGGEMPWFSFGEFAGVDEAAFALAIGEVSDPVLSHRGWHVLRLEERRPRESPRPATAQFEFKTRERLVEQRLSQRLAQIFESEGWSWNEAGSNAFVEGLITYEREARVKQKELSDRREAGETLTAADYELARAPEFEADVAALPIASGPGAAFTVSDAVNAYADAPSDLLPLRYDEATVSGWLRDRVLASVTERWASAGGFVAGSEAERHVRDAEDFVFVERLYRSDVQDKVRPTAADRREFFETYRDSYRWRAELEATVVRTDDQATADAARSALLEGADASALASRFAADSTFSVVRTAKTRDFELPGVLDEVVPGLNSLVRGLPDEVGGVTAAQRLANQFVIARIDGVGDTAPMTFEEAEPMVAEHCSSYLREVRLRSLLDSLRTVYRGSVDSTVAVQLTWPPRE